MTRNEFGRYVINRMLIIEHIMNDNVRFLGFQFEALRETGKILSYLNDILEE